MFNKREIECSFNKNSVQNFFSLPSLNKCKVIQNAINKILNKNKSNKSKNFKCSSNLRMYNSKSFTFESLHYFLYFYYLLL